MLPDRVSNPGPLTYESGALYINDKFVNVGCTKNQIVVIHVRVWFFLAVTDITELLKYVMYCCQILTICSECMLDSVYWTKL